MKILEFSAKLNIGGAQAVAANIARYADPSMEFCYVVFGDEVGEYEADIIARGGRVVHIPEPKENMPRFFRTIVGLMKRERFDVVHAHTMLNCGVIMLAAWAAGVPGRISHSHTTRDESSPSLVRRLYRGGMRLLIRLFGTDWCACGIDAGKALYGERWFSKHGRVIRNGIDLPKFRFSPSNREKIRKMYGVEDRFVIGHAGHYVKVKNQVFLIRLMERIRLRDPRAVLLLFGGGPDREMLQQWIDRLDLHEHVRLMGNVSNMAQVLSAFDVFAFPSLYEGTPLALIEAQANGLPCVISDTIPDDACLTELVRKLPLDASEDRWADALLTGARPDPDGPAERVRQTYGTIETAMEELYAIFRKYSRNGRT